MKQAVLLPKEQNEQEKIKRKQKYLRELFQQTRYTTPIAKSRLANKKDKL